MELLPSAVVWEVEVFQIGCILPLAKGGLGRTSTALRGHVQIYVSFHSLPLPCPQESPQCLLPLPSFLLLGIKSPGGCLLGDCNINVKRIYKLLQCRKKKTNNPVKKWASDPSLFLLHCFLEHKSCDALDMSLLSDSRPRLGF